MNLLSEADRTALQRLSDLLDAEGAVLAAVRIDGLRLGDITAAKGKVLETLGQWPVSRYGDNHAVQSELKRLTRVNERNGRMLAIRTRSNRRIFDAVSAMVGGGLYSRRGTTTGS